MLLKSVRRMWDHYSEGQLRWTHHLLLVVWQLAAALPAGSGYFLGDTKAVLNGCEDHWTLQDRAAVPLLFQMTVCVDVRVVVPGAWVAFSYSTVHAPRPELGLEGDEGALYGWLLRVRHRFPLRLSMTHWHRVCLRRDVPRNSFSLEVDGETVAERTVIAQAIPPSGSLWLGCRPRDRPPGAALGEVELYLFRMWADVGDHGLCEDGTVIGWDAQDWGLTSPRARQRDPDLLCAFSPGRGRLFTAPPRPPTVTTSLPAMTSPRTSSRTSPVTGEQLRVCDCTAFCNSASQFFALRININSPSANVDLLKTLLSGLSAGSMCDTLSGSACKDSEILTRYQGAHLECNGTPQRLYSCTVTLQMSGSVNSCSLNQLLQQLIDNSAGMTTERPLTRLVVCGRPGRTVRTMLTSNLTWIPSDLLLSDMCQPEPTLLRCEENEMLAVLLRDSCPPTTSPSSHTDAPGTSRPDTTAPLATSDRTQSSTVPPVLNTGSPNTSVTSSDGTPAVTHNTVTAEQKTPEFTTLSSVDSTQQTHTSASTHGTATMSPNDITTSPNNTTEYNVTTTDSFTPSPNDRTEYNITTTDTFTTSPNDTIKYNVTTAGTFTSSPNNTTEYNVTTSDTLTTSPNDITEYNVTTAGTFTTSPNNTTEYNVTTTDSFTPSPNDRTEYNITTTDTFTTSPNDTIKYNVTTEGTFTSSSNNTTEYNVTTTDTLTPSPNDTTEYNITTTDTFTTSPNNTTEYNVTTTDTFTPSPNDTTEYNVTTTDTFTPSPNDTTEYNVTTTDSFTPSPNDRTEYNITTTDTFTTSPNDTIKYNVTTTDTFTTSPNNTTEYNVTTTDTFTTSPNYTIKYNVTTAGTFTSSPNKTTEYNVTTTDTLTPSPNDTTEYNVTTTDTLTPSPNDTTEYNVTTTDSFTPSPNDTIKYNVTTAGTFTSSPNNTTEYNVTTTDTLTPSPNDTTEYNVTTTDSFTPSPNDTIKYNVTTAGTFTSSPNNTTEYNVTTTDTFTSSPNNTTEYNVTTTNTFTPSPDDTTAYNVTTSGGHGKQRNGTIAKEYNVTTEYNNRNLHNHTTINPTTFTPPHTTNNDTTTSKHFTTLTTANSSNVHNDTTATSHATNRTFTAAPSLNHTVGYDVTTVAFSYTTASDNHTKQDNFTTSSPNESNMTTAATITSLDHTASNNYTKEYNVTTANNNGNLHNGTIDATITTVTPSFNYTTVHSVTTASNNQTTASNKYTTEYNVTEADNNRDLNNGTINTTMSTFTPCSNVTTGANSHTTVDNVTTSPTLENTTSSKTTKPTVAPLDNQTGNHTTASSLTAGPPGVNLTTAADAPFVAPTTAMKTVSPTTLQTSALTSATAATTQEEQADELLRQTQDASQLNSSQVARLTERLEKLLDGPAVSQAVGQKAVHIISNLMEGDSLALSASASRLIRVVDGLGLKLVVGGDSEVISSRSLVLAVRTVDGTNFTTTSVDVFSTDDVQLRALSTARSGRPPLGSVLLPSSLTAGLSPEQQLQASRVQFTFYTKSALFQDATLDNKTIVSPVLGSSVADLSISDLIENVQFTIGNIDPVHANFSASCAFWDFGLNGGGGGWSAAGCFLVDATADATTCSCNHLTSFAILLDLSRGGLKDRQQAQILTFITYIGCGISAAFLAVTLLTYLSFEKLLRDIPAKILVQLCTSLLLLNLVFLVDGWLALYPAAGLCVSTAFFLHYFLLTSFTWAGLEALHLYLSVVRVFTPYLSRYMLKFSLLGWGLPLIVVIVVISVDKDNYGLVKYAKYTDGTSDDFCWLRSDVAFYVGVVAYFLLIFALCLLVFIMVMVQLARIKKQNPQNQSPHRGVLTDLRSIAGLVILLGLSWGFALFAWGPLYLPFVYLFSIFNTLQGFLVFVFHCAVKENARRQWRTYLCCGRLRLAENSEWSRTATQNNRNQSAPAASALQFTSRSSSVISGGSMFLDSGISDGSGSDVVLNDIHGRSVLF